jgi:hypothetical protein
MATLNFDASQVDPHVGFDPIPAGKYLAIIAASEMKPTKGGAGRYLQVEYQIVEGAHKGRKMWSRHNLEHSNAQTVQIARGELSAICRAVGVMTPQDSAELHNLPLTITVKMKTREDTGEPANEISGWAKKETALASATGKPAQAPANTPPWARRQG